MSSLEESRRRRRMENNNLVKQQLNEFMEDSNEINDIQEDNDHKVETNDNSFFKNDSTNNEKKSNGTLSAKQVNTSDYLNQREDGSYIIDPTITDKVPSVYRINVQLYAILKERLKTRKMSDYMNKALASEMARDGLLTKSDVDTMKKIISNLM